MRKKIVPIKACVGTLLSIILITSILVPFAEAKSNNEKVIVKTIPKIDVKENSRTSQIVQVGDILITLKTDQNHTKGVLNVKNLTTGKTETTNIVVNKNKGKFSSKIASQGTPSSNIVTDFDPFEPGTTAKVLKSNAISTAQSTTWTWDNITFVDNHNWFGFEDYPHPDYNSYENDSNGQTIKWDQPFQIITLQGYVLNHEHVDSITSNTIIILSAWVGTAAISSIIGIPIDKDKIIEITRNTILDESGAIWFWDTIGSDRFAYLRFAPFTIQDKLGIGNPRPGTVPPVIGNVALSNYTPNAGDYIRINVGVTDNVGVSKVAANGIYLTNQSMCLPNVTCVWNGDIIADNGKHAVNVLAYDTEGNIARNSSASYTGQIQIKSDRLTINQQLNQNQAIVSQNGNYELILQRDGNVVLYNRLNNAIWSTNTQNSNAQELIMQNDGNLVLYKYLNQIQPLWATNTQANWWNKFSGAYVVMQNDGNLVVYSSGNIALWASNTVGK